MIEGADGTFDVFRYYFAQREAVETVVWLHDVRGVRDKFDLLRFDASGAVSAGMFDEAWPRYVVKMATGSGKTKVLALLLAWSYFHKLYEPASTLARNFLVITPNIIVLDRLRQDFDGLRIFFKDPILPDNGHQGRNWRDDFQVTSEGSRASPRKTRWMLVRKRLPVSARSRPPFRVQLSEGRDAVDLTDDRKAVNTLEMKTTFDLPDSLVRMAKALAAQQGRPLRDLVAEAIDQRLGAEPSELSDGACETRRALWAAWKARLIQEPDGTWRNPEGIDDESFFEILDDIRGEPWAGSDPFLEIQPPKSR